MQDRRRLALVLLVAYPVLVHGGIVLQLRWLHGLALQVLFAGIFLAPLSERRPAAWLGWLVYAGVTLSLMVYGGSIYALYLMPLVLLAMAFSAFAHSLAAGRTPLVTGMAQALHGALSPELLRYTRQVTQLWAAVLAGMFLVALALAFSGHREWWSLFTNVITYLLMAAMFLLEFIYRRWRFPDHGRESFTTYLRRLMGQAHRFRGTSEAGRER